MILRKIFITLSLLWVLSPQLAACGEPQYPVLDSKIPVDEQTHPVWLSNSQVIFVGYVLDPANPPQQMGLAWKIPQGVYVWDLEKGMAVRDHHWDGTNNWCVVGEFRSYHRLRPGTDNTYDLVEGKEGQEQIQPLPAKWSNRISCRHYYAQLPYWRQEGRNTRSLPLLEEHGHLDFGLPSRADPSKATPVLLYPPDQKDPKQLPFTGEQVQFHVAYFEFADAYLLKGQSANTYATRIWLLKPDGTVTLALEPTGKAWERMGWGGYALTKRGLFLSGGRGDYARVGTRGGYLIGSIEGSPRRLIAGSVRNEAVSPDGCKVAFVHVLHDQAAAESVKAVREGKPGTRTLKVLDLCKGN